MAKNDKKSIQVPNVPKWLRDEAKIKAVKEGRPLAEVIRELLERWVKENGKKGDDG